MEIHFWIADGGIFNKRGNDLNQQLDLADSPLGVLREQWQNVGMATKNDLMAWTLDSLRQRGGSAHHIDVAKDIWREHEDELRRSGDLFFTWQYDLRWAGQKLRHRGELEPVAGSSHGDGVWRLRTQ